MDIFPDHRKYLAFSWEFGSDHTRFFQLTVLPSGLSSAPFIYTKLLKPLETHWRVRGIPISIFFYDGVGSGPSLQVAKLNSLLVRSDLSRCGLEINHDIDISNVAYWEPTRKLPWIGCNIDTHNGLIFARDDRIAFFKISFSHLHYNVIQRTCVRGNLGLKLQNSLKMPHIPYRDARLYCDANGYPCIGLLKSFVLI